MNLPPPKIAIIPTVVCSDRVFGVVESSDKRRSARHGFAKPPSTPNHAAPRTLWGRSSAPLGFLSNTNHASIAPACSCLRAQPEARAAL